MEKNIQKWVDEILSSEEENSHSEGEIWGSSSSSTVTNEDFDENVSDTENSENINATNISNTLVDESDINWCEDTKAIPSFKFEEASGIKVNLNQNSSPQQIFDQFFSDDIIDVLVSSMNSYAKQLESSVSTPPSTRKRPSLIYREVTKEELYQFLGLCLLQGQNKKPSIKKMFSKSALYFQPTFGATMSGRRFMQILRVFSCHASNNTFEKCKLEKIMPFVHLVIKKFQKVFVPGKDLSLDESLLLFRGRLSFKQYIKGKRARYGIKFYELTTSDGYILNFKVYAGKEIEPILGSKTREIVLNLMDPYLNRGHHLYMDNYYNSVELSNLLLSFRTHTTGTLRSNRKGNPKIVTTKKLKKGEMIWRRQKNVYVSKWKDKREVLSITTAHHPQMVEVENARKIKKRKPIDVASYNEHMAGVDRADQLLSYYSSPRKTIRWYKKVLFHVLDMIVWNSYYIFKKFHPKRSFLEFRDQLILSLLNFPPDVKEGKDLMSLLRNSGRPTGGKLESNPIDLVTQHFPRKIAFPPRHEGLSKRNRFYKRCRQCLKNRLRKETSYECTTCPDNPPLCPECFEDFHLSI